MTLYFAVLIVNREYQKGEKLIPIIPLVYLLYDIILLQA